MTFNTKILFYNSFEELFDKINNNYSNIKRIIVTDDNLHNFYNSNTQFNTFFNNSTLILNSGEKYKTIQSILEISKFAMEKNLTRHDTFIGLGGGVICDMTAFASSIYKRGAKLELIPTTLLSMVDAAIGGKTGCDFNNCKNMLGTFYPATTLHICPDYLKTLNDIEFHSGLAEVIKTALLYDKDLLNILNNNSDLVLNRDKDILLSIIKKCVKAKILIVKKDFTEKKIRKQLNFGHTFGHALESICGLGNVTHGDAVAWGIARAAELSFNLHLCSLQYKDFVFSLLKKYNYCTDAKHPLIPITSNTDSFISEMHNDKKNIGNNITIILQKDICKTKILEISETEIKKVL